IGLELIDLKIEGLDTTPEYRERLFWIKQTGAATYVLQTDTLRDVAKELGKSPGASLGAGMMIIPPLTQPPPSSQSTQQPQQTPATGVVAQPTTKTCPKCGRPVPMDAIFCPYCGYRFPQSRKCPYCGREIPADSVFCPYCGKKLS
ncbi:MAG TPA: zinc-ribbon domain-containing protein, partial [Thermofilum sp.]|nr:zinc-ribbon domain-containing protein [Thermofilum sp.]